MAPGWRVSSACVASRPLAYFAATPKVACNLLRVRTTNALTAALREMCESAPLFGEVGCLLDWTTETTTRDTDDASRQQI